MARSMRIEFPGAVYHVTSRGDRREAIFDDDQDAQRFLAVLGQATDRFGARLLAYCLMTNHYHLVLVTPTGGLSLHMRHINGVYAQSYNQRHGLTGHLFQSRYKAILVDRDAYLMALCRYVELNPVRAGLAAAASNWSWSSYAAHVGAAEAPLWLDVASLHAYVLGRPVTTAADHIEAARAYAELVAAAPEEPLWAAGLHQQIYLGDADFVARMQALADPARAQSKQIPHLQRSAPLTLIDWLASCPTREEALLMAYRKSGISMTAMAAELGVSTARVSQLIKRAESGLLR